MNPSSPDVNFSTPENYRMKNEVTMALPKKNLNSLYVNPTELLTFTDGLQPPEATWHLAS